MFNCGNSARENRELIPLEMPDDGLDLEPSQGMNKPFMAPTTSRDLWFEWLAFFNDVDLFQKKEFASSPLEGWLRKTIEECQELLENPGCRLEKADVAMVIFGLLNKLCSDPENLPFAKQKLEINKGRTWRPTSMGTVGMWRVTNVEANPLSRRQASIALWPYRACIQKVERPRK